MPFSVAAKGQTLSGFSATLSCPSTLQSYHWPCRSRCKSHLYCAVAKLASTGLRSVPNWGNKMQQHKRQIGSGVFETREWPTLIYSTNLTDSNLCVWFQWCASLAYPAARSPTSSQPTTTTVTWPLTCTMPTTEWGRKHPMTVFGERLPFVTWRMRTEWGADQRELRCKMFGNGSWRVSSFNIVMNFQRRHFDDLGCCTVKCLVHNLQWSQPCAWLRPHVRVKVRLRLYLCVRERSAWSQCVLNHLLIIWLQSSYSNTV